MNEFWDRLFQLLKELATQVRVDVTVEKKISVRVYVDKEDTNEYRCS